jgi:hypothetical protein
MESTTFTNITRVQLTTTATKPCTYIANYKNKRVFVKGPFRTLQDASVASTVMTIKKEIFPNLIITQMVVLSLLVDMELDCQLGIRKSMMSKTGYFQVHDCYITENVIPTVLKGSPNAWKKPVLVIDFSKIKSVSHFKYEKSGVYGSVRTKFMDDLVMNTIISWVLGCGADLAGRNFLKVGDRCVQVDMDYIKKYNWTLGDTYVASTRSMAGEIMKSYVSKYWTSYFKDAIQSIKTMSEFPRTVTIKTMSIDQIFGSKKRKASSIMDLFVKKQKVNDIVVGKSTSTFRHAVDTWGYSITLRKSDFQKAVRRGNVNQALVAFFACYNIGEMFPNEPSAKSIQTNIINRMIICSMEDIGVSNFKLVESIINVVVPMITKKDTRDPFTLAKYVILLCNSSKSRIQSHMTHYYAKQNNPTVDIGVDIDNPACFSVASIGDGELVWEKVGHNAFKNEKMYWGKCAQRNKRAVAQYVLAVSYFIMSGSDDQKNCIENCNSIVLPTLDDTTHGIMKNEMDLPPKEEANDMHVTGGHTLDAKRHFRREGSRVENENFLFKNQELLDSYINSVL